MHVCVCVCMHMHMHIQVHTYIYHIDMLRSDSPTRLFILYQRTSSYNMYVYTPTHTHTHTKLSMHLYLYGADSVAPAFVVPIFRGREKHGKFRHQGVDLQQSDAGLLCCLVWFSLCSLAIIESTPDIPPPGGGIDKKKSSKSSKYTHKPWTGWDRVTLPHIHTQTDRILAGGTPGMR